MARHLGTVLRRTLCVDEEASEPCVMSGRWPFSSCSSRRRRAAPPPPADRVRVSGHVEATEVQVSAQVGGQLLELRVAEGDRVAAGDVIARLDTRDTELAHPAREGRTPAGRRAAAPAPRRIARRRHPPGRRAVPGGERGNRSRAGGPHRRGGRPRALRGAARVQRRLAQAARRCAGAARRGERTAAGGTRAGARRPGDSRPAARPARAARRSKEPAARLAAVDAQIATLEKAVADATITAPAAGVVTEKLVEQGELIAPRMPLVVITDLDHAWADVFVDEPAVPRLRVGQAATLHTDAGGDGDPRHGHVHLAEGRVHAAQRADRRGALAARVPREGQRRQHAAAC